MAIKFLRNEPGLALPGERVSRSCDRASGLTARCSWSTERARSRANKGPGVNGLRGLGFAMVASLQGEGGAFQTESL